MRRLTACWQLTALPGVPPSYCAVKSIPPSDLPAFEGAGTSSNEIPSEGTAPELEIPTWDGGSRINLVFFGLRGGDISGEDCPACTDTIILLTVDPVTKTAGMLSIPRDMWVNIPGFGYSRINTAWTLGEAAKLPGGGPGLAMKTVSQFIGVPLQYYVQVDFGTFVSFINMLDGIDIYSDERLKLDPAGPGTDHFVLTCCGIRHLNGQRALAYARCRDESQGCSGGDVGRAKRQQKVILAIRDKVLSPAYFAKLLAQAPQLYDTFSSGIHTNMPLGDALKLAALTKDIPIESIKQGVIDNNMAVFANVTLNGVPASVLRPIPDMIRVLRDEIFIPGGPLSPLAQGDPQTLMQADAARIRITNNTYTAPTIFTVSSDGIHLLYPWAKDVAGNVSTVFASPGFVWVDNTAPTVDTFTATTPSNSLNIPITVFTASDTVRLTGYLITTSPTPPSAGDSGWTGTAPTTYTVASDGNYTLYPWAMDAAGNVSAVFASPRTVVVDTTAPDTTIDGKPATLDNDSTPTFTFSGNDGAGSGIASLMCRMDGGTYTTCASPFTSSALSDGSHTFDVYAIDLLGNTDASPASHAWTLETIAPIVTSVTRVNPSPTNLASVGFTVTFSKPVTGVDMVGPTFDDFSLTNSGITGAAVTSVSGSGSTYTITVNTGSGNGTLRLDVSTGGHIVDAALNPLAAGFTTGEIYNVIKSAIFTDVPLDYWANTFIERLYNAGITGGCSLSPLMYCPETNVNRAQMAVFLLRGEHGSAYVPPAVGTGTGFTDVPDDYWAAAWIKQLAAEGITSGCGPNLYCPETSVTRDQMAVFLLRAEHGASYTPPPAAGVFTDVPTDHWAAAWIEQLAVEGITGGCGADTYCPSTPVTRAQMAVFLVRAFNLP